MKVKVYLPPFASFKALDERGWLEIPDGATLADAVKAVGMPKPVAKLLRPMVNSEVVPFDTELHDGDVVGFFSLISGG